MPYSIMGVGSHGRCLLILMNTNLSKGWISLKGYHATLRRIAYVGKGERAP